MFGFLLTRERIEGGQESRNIAIIRARVTWEFISREAWGPTYISGSRLKAPYNIIIVNSIFLL